MLYRDLFSRYRRNDCIIKSIGQQRRSGQPLLLDFLAERLINLNWITARYEHRSISPILKRLSARAISHFYRYKPQHTKSLTNTFAFLIRVISSLLVAEFIVHLKINILNNIRRLFIVEAYSTVIVLQTTVKCARSPAWTSPLETSYTPAD